MKYTYPSIYKNMYRSSYGIKSSPMARPSLVYYIKLTFISGLVIYKIGYTSTTIVNRVEGYYNKRTGKYIPGLGLPKGCTYRIIGILYKGSKVSAYKVEQDLHKLHSVHRYTGVKLIRNGYTELYRVDVLGLDKIR